MKKIAYILIPALIFILIVGAALACGSSDAAKKVESIESSEVSEAKTTLAQVYNIGDSVDYKGVVITAKSFKKSNGSDFDKPKDGMEYVIITIHIKNNSSDKVSYNPFYFKMQNSKGQITDTAFTTVDSQTALASGELTAGGVVEGTVSFEEPKDDAGLVLIYQASILNENEVIKFNIK